MDTTATKGQGQDLETLIPEFKQRLSSHGLDISKLDDNQWTEIVNEVRPLFSGYGENYEGGNTFAR